MSPLEVLVAARELIADEAKWTQGTAARGANGKTCPPRSKMAKQWCAVGAIYYVAGCAYPSLHPNVATEAHDLLSETAARSEFRRCMSEVNDLDGHAATLAMFDRAIAAQRAAEGEKP